MKRSRFTEEQIIGVLFQQSRVEFSEHIVERLADDVHYRKHPAWRM